jgi:hypothetical protein
MEIKKLNASCGWLWIRQGIYLFKKSPLLLIVLTFIAIVGSIAVSSLPVIGELLAAFLFPVIFSGLLWGCHALEHDEELELAHLFLGFQRKTPQLVMLGGINLVGNILILGVIKITGGGTLIDLMMSNSANEDPTVIIQAISGAGISIMIGIVLSFIFLFVTQFSLMLVTFDKHSPIEALKISTQGGMLNLAPLSVYGIIIMLFAFLASIPLMLGWIVLIPVMITSFYAAYRGIFPWPHELAANQPATPETEV